jgi:thiol-disulfide isomerase/thioredoxin
VKHVNSLIISIFILASPLFCFCQMNNNPDQAFSAALESRKPVLLYFSGSDWCLPCQRFNKAIISDSTFKKFADENLILVEADFPQRTRLPRQQVLWNEKLAEEFNPDGVFPYLILLNADKTIIASLDYLHYDPAQFIEEINNAISAHRK